MHAPVGEAGFQPPHAFSATRAAVPRGRQATRRAASVARSLPLRLALAWSLVGLCGCPQLPSEPCTLPETSWATWTATASTARVFDELALHAIRRDLPVPTVHARNLFHLSAAMYDAWAAYDTTASGLYSQDRARAPADVEAARREAVAFAAYRVLLARFGQATGGPQTVGCLAEAMERLGYDASRTDTQGDAPSSVGNRVAARMLELGRDDGANEAHDYADTTGFYAVNPPLQVWQRGTTVLDPNAWQPLEFEQAFTQNGIQQASGVQPYMGAHWRNVRPFAMQRSGALYHEPGLAPSVDDPEMKRWLLDVLRRQSKLDPALPETIDVSPGAWGNNPVGTNAGTGHAANPVTGAPYAANVVPLADFGRVIAEYWADGPTSETPPGHWNVLANEVADSPGFARRLHGTGDALGRLEWDVKVYLALNGALHDAAITAWEVKRAFTTARPISLVRYAAQLGQSSDDAGVRYAPRGLPLEDGLVEVVTAASSVRRHAGLPVGAVVVRAWEPTARDGVTGAGGVHWREADTWTTYQRTTFVTPAFPGFISGHSTFSRAAAEVLADFTGSDFFPGGLSQHLVPRDVGLQFERGPTVDVRLQWATYFDAADQAGQSRLWGGIHVEPDDLVGRRLGQQVGRDAAAKATALFEGR